MSEFPSFLRLNNSIPLYVDIQHLKKFIHLLNAWIASILAILNSPLLFNMTASPPLFFLSFFINIYGSDHSRWDFWSSHSGDKNGVLFGSLARVRVPWFAEFVSGQVAIVCCHLDVTELTSTFLCVSTLTPSLRGLLWAPKLDWLLFLCASHLHFSFP